MGRHKKIRTCPGCGTTESVNPRSGYCITCAMARQRASITQLQEKRGPMYEKWRDGLIKHLEEVDKTG